MDHPKVTAVDADIDAARQSLTARFAALEDRVTATIDRATGTVDHATSEVRGTIDHAVDGVRSLFDDTNENFRGVFDIKNHVRKHPWQGVLLAIGAGLATRMLTRTRTLATAIEPGDEPRSPIADIATIVRRELTGIGEMAVKAASQRLRANIETLSGPAPVPQNRAGALRDSHNQNGVLESSMH